MPKTIIFDNDGTLIDSVDLHARSWQDAFRHYGRELPFADVRQQIGKGGDQFLPVFLSQAEIDRFGKEVEALRSRIFKENYLDKVRPFPQVRDLFERLRADGKQLLLASSAKADEVAAYKRIANIGDLIDEETSTDDAEHSKPDPDIFQAALDKAGVQASQSLVVGDTPYDAEAAGKLGIKTIGLLCGGFPQAQLRDAGCIAIYQDPAALLAAYNESPLATRVRSTTF